MIPWILESDTELLCHVEGKNKVLTCLSNLACSVTQKAGLTELSLVDHTLKQVLEDRDCDNSQLYCQNVF